MHTHAKSLSEHRDGTCNLCQEVSQQGKIVLFHQKCRENKSACSGREERLPAMCKGRHLSMWRQLTQAQTASPPQSFWAKSCVCQEGLHSDWDAQIPRNSLLTTREAPLPDHSGCPSTTRSSSGSIVIATSMEIFVSTYMVCLAHVPVCSEHIPCS